MSDEEAWEEHYRGATIDHLPWNARGPDPKLVQLVESGRIPKGQALDLGTGPGHDAAHRFRRACGISLREVAIEPLVIWRFRAGHG